MFWLWFEKACVSKAYDENFTGRIDIFIDSKTYSDERKMYTERDQTKELAP